MTYKEWRDKKYPGIEKNNIVAEAVAITAWLASRRETLAHIREQVEERLREVLKRAYRFEQDGISGQYERDIAEEYIGILSIIERAGGDG
jgi:hypothetical protein